MVAEAEVRRDLPTRRSTVTRRRSFGFSEFVLVVAGLVVIAGAATLQPVIAALGIAIGLCTLTTLRFESLILFALLLRASLDATKGGVGGFEPATVLGMLFIGAVATREALAANGPDARRPVRAPFTTPLLVLLGVMVLSAVVSDDPVDSLIEALRFAGVVAMVVSLERLLADRRAGRRVLITVFAAGVVPIAMGIVQAVGGGGRSIGDFSRITGTFLHPNPYSIFLVMLILLAVALLPHVARRVQLALVLIMVPAGVLLILTYTRGSWIALVLGLLVIGVLQSKKLVALLVVGSIAVVLFVPGVAARFSDLGTETQESGAANNSLVWRVEYWGEAVGLADRSPFLGIGLHGIERATASGKNAHNDVVRIYVETGVAGLLAYLALAVSMFVAARRAIKATTGRNLARGVAVGNAAILSVIALVSLSSNVITQVVLLWYVGAVAMLAVALSRPTPTLPDQGRRRARASHPNPAPGLPPAAAPKKAVSAASVAEEPPPAFFDDLLVVTPPPRRHD